MRKLNNIIVILFLLAAIDIAQANYKDVFFSGATQHMIRTEDIKSGIRFSACQVNKQYHATCTPTAIVNKTEFPAMRKCMDAYQAAIPAGVYGATLLIIWASGGSAAMINTGGSIAWMTTSIIGVLSPPDIRDIYQADTEGDVDHVSKISYEDFVSALQTSFEASAINCDVSDDVQILDESIENYKLTPSQIKMLTLKE